MLESLFNSVAGRNFICKRLLLFASPQNTITNSSGEFGPDDTSTECKVSIFFKNVQKQLPGGVLFFNKIAKEHLWWRLLNVTILFHQMQSKIKKSFFNILINILIIYKEDKKSFFNIPIKILITPGKLGRYDVA